MAGSRRLGSALYVCAVGFIALWPTLRFDPENAAGWNLSGRALIPVEGSRALAICGPLLGDARGESIARAFDDPLMPVHRGLAALTGTSPFALRLPESLALALFGFAGAALRRGSARVLLLASLIPMSAWVGAGAVPGGWPVWLALALGLALTAHRNAPFGPTEVAAVFTPPDAAFPTRLPQHQARRAGPPAFRTMWRVLCAGALLLVAVWLALPTWPEQGGSSLSLAAWLGFCGAVIVIGSTDLSALPAFARLGGFLSLGVAFCLFVGGTPRWSGLALVILGTCAAILAQAARPPRRRLRPLLALGVILGLAALIASPMLPTDSADPLLSLETARKREAPTSRILLEGADRHALLFAALRGYGPRSSILLIPEDGDPRAVALRLASAYGSTDAKVDWPTIPWRRGDGTWSDFRSVAAELLDSAGGENQTR